MSWVVFAADSLEALREMESNSVDSIVQDPPAWIGFMGKKWDKEANYTKFCEVVHEEFRVLKPGGHILCWALPRTSWMAGLAIHLAGFEIRDVIAHLFGQGFPKNHDIAKAIQKASGVKPLGKKPASLGMANNPQWNALKNQLIMPEPEGQAAEWEGWGTALKPAREDWILARKPISEKTVAANVLKWGTGAINIDGCRIPTGDKLGGGAAKAETVHHKDKGDGWARPWMESDEAREAHAERVRGNIAKSEELGRYPANVTFDEEAAALLDEQSGTSPAKPGRTGLRGGTAVFGQKGIGSPDKEGKWPSDPGGGASRFFKTLETTLCLPCAIVMGAVSLSPQIERVGATVVGHAQGKLTGQKESSLTGAQRGLKEHTTNVTQSALKQNSENATAPTQDSDAKSSQGWRPTNTSLNSPASLAVVATPTGTTKITADPLMCDSCAGLAISKSTSLSMGHGVQGSASRFTYVAKPSRREKEAGCEDLPRKTAAELTGRQEDSAGLVMKHDDGSEKANPYAGTSGSEPRANHHPTVKSVALMRYLCRMVTPPGGTVLDPYCGSGTTGVASVMEGFDFIGIDENPDYVQIAEARIKYAEEGASDH